MGQNWWQSPLVAGFPNLGLAPGPDIEGIDPGCASFDSRGIRRDSKDSLQLLLPVVEDSS